MSNVHFVQKGCDGHLKIAILPQFLTSNVDFVRKGCEGTPQNRNFTAVFNVQRPFRVKWLRWTPQNRNFTSVFDVQRPFRVKRMRFVALRRHRPRLRREIERRARGDPQMWRCEDVGLQMWGCEDVDLQMCRCEDVDQQVWGCEDVDEQMWGCEDVDQQVWGCEDVDQQMWRCEDVDQQMWRCEDVECRWADVRVWRCRSAGVRVWRCRSADVKVWRCRSADVKVWRCRSADVRVWRCRSANVRVWRCIYPGCFFTKKPSQALSGNMPVSWRSYLVGGIPTPLKNMTVRLDHPNCWRKNVPHHQPVGFHVIYDDFMKISWDESYQTDDRWRMQGEFWGFHTVDGQDPACRWWICIYIYIFICRYYISYLNWRNYGFLTHLADPSFPKFHISFALKGMHRHMQNSCVLTYSGQIQIRSKGRPAWKLTSSSALGRAPQQDSTSPFFLPLNLFHSVIFRGKYRELIRQSIKFGVTLAGHIHLFLHPSFSYSNPHVGKTLTSVVHIPKFT